MQNIRFFKIFILLILLLTSSCELLTPKLWKKSYYNDYIGQFLVTEDSKSIIFVGNKYHYIFSDDGSTIQKILAWKDKSKLKMLIKDFEVTSSNGVKGNINLIMSKNNINKDVKSFIKRLGFKSEPLQHHASDYIKNIYLSGRRYLPEKNVDYSTGGKLDREYLIKVQYNSFGDIATKIAKTPLTVVNDIVIIAIVGTSIVVQAVILLPFIAITVVLDLIT